MGTGRRGRVLLVLVVLATAPGVVSAHEISGRFEAPLPLELLFGGAAVTVAVTAIVVAVTVERPPSEAETGPFLTLSPSVAAGLRLTARGVFFVAFLLAIVAGLFGKQAPSENFATVFVWPVWLKGVAILAALVGSPWRVFSPWRTLYDGLPRVEGKPIAVAGPYPSWLGVWPALGGYLLWVGILENLTGVPRSPNATALLLIVYTIVMLGGGLAFGPRWFRQADTLAVLYRLFGRVAPVKATRTEGGGYRIRARWPWQGVRHPVSGLAVAAFVIATVYTVSFDGFTSTPEFQTVFFGIPNAVGGGLPVGVLLYVAGFLVFLATFGAVIGIVYAGIEDVSADWHATAVAFSPTVLPITIAYEIAHNYPFVLGNIGQLPATLWLILGSGHGPVIDLLGWLTFRAFWWSQVLLIVGGHIVAVITAHYVALAQYPTLSAARRGHAPLVVLMVGYTVLSLWIVSRPIVT